MVLSVLLLPFSPIPSPPLSNLPPDFLSHLSPSPSSCLSPLTPSLTLSLSICKKSFYRPEMAKQAPGEGKKGGKVNSTHQQHLPPSPSSSSSKPRSPTPSRSCATGEAQQSLLQYTTPHNNFHAPLYVHSFMALLHTPT